MNEPLVFFCVFVVSLIAGGWIVGTDKRVR